MVRILFVDNNEKALFNFRGSVIEHFVKRGHEVAIVVPQNGAEEHEINGIKRFEARMKPSSSNPLYDIPYFIDLVGIMRKWRPDVVITYTIKPNIYATIAAKLLGIKRVAFVAGLGYMFADDSLKRKAGRMLYKLGLRNATHVICLNNDNHQKLIQSGFISDERSDVLAGGEGVDLSRFSYVEDDFNSVRFLMVARVLYDKGYSEYVEAAQNVKRRYPDAIIDLVGAMAPDSPMGVDEAIVRRDVASGAINYLGETSNIMSELRKAGTVVVLPSYHEGMNRALMEAAAMGRPSIASDILGCQEIVDDGSTGFLVPKKDANALASAMQKMIELPSADRKAMSRRARSKAEALFDINTVIGKYADIFRRLGLEITE